MNRVVVAHQPDFIPYLGFFHRFLQADVYVALDHVQFARRAWTHRDKIKTREGARWLSLSVKKCPINTAIKEVELSAGKLWRDDNLNMLCESYRQAPFFDIVMPAIQDVYRTPSQQLVDLNLQLLDLICEWLDIHIPRVRSSELAAVGTKSEMIANVVAAVDGTHYLSGIGARDYHDQEQFDRIGINVIWQDFHHPRYTQLHGEFIPYLSILDALFNCGPEGTAQMLRSA